MQDIEEMDSASIKRLAVLETKLDYLIDHSKKAEMIGSQLHKRVDDLENHRHWMTGAAAAVTALVGVLTFAGTVYIENEVENQLQGTSVLDNICKAYRKEKRPGMETPQICRI